MSKYLSMKAMLAIVVTCLLAWGAELYLNLAADDANKDKALSEPQQFIGVARVPQLQVPEMFNGQSEVVDEEAEPQVAAVDLRTQAEFQQQQQGHLKQLYIQDKVYRLTGITDATTPTAILSATNTAGEHQSYLAVTLGQAVGPYQVSSISSTVLALREDDRQVMLSLFKPLG